MENMIRKALDHAGYDCAATKENLFQCFLDYVDAGVFKNLDYDEAVEMIAEGDLTITEVCWNLIKYCR